MARRYYLRDGVHACMHDSRLIFLDLNRDVFGSLGIEASRHVAERLALDDLDVCDENASSGRAGSSAVLDELAEVGILTTGTRASRGMPISVARPGRKELPGVLFGEAPIRLSDIWKMLSAYASTITHLRALGLRHALRRVERRTGTMCSTPSAHSVACALDRFRRLSTVLARRRGHCLFDTFFLLEFLARHRIAGLWCFGVKLDDFHAHCWAQWGDVLIGEDAEFVDQFSVIMRA